MSIKTKDVTKIFFGKPIKIIDSTDPSLRGIEGILVDETKNTFLLSTRKGLKRVVKNTIIFISDNETYDGKNMIRRFENRIRR